MRNCTCRSTWKYSKTKWLMSAESSRGKLTGMLVMTSFQLVCCSKWILSPETTEERLVNFIQARSTAVGVKPPNVINSRMFEPRDGTERIGARLTVASSDAGVLQATNFWPRPTYARLWNFNIVRLEKPELLPLESHSNSSKRESAAAPVIA